MKNLSFFFFLFVTLGLQAGHLSPTYLRCEYLINPLAIETQSPRLSWEVVADRRAEVQTAYQIQVADSPEALKQGQANQWDSGKTLSNQTNQIYYRGKPLASRNDCYWRVKTWDKDGNASEWSEPAYWKMGLLDISDWKGQWIGMDNRKLNKNDSLFLPPSPFLRKQWKADKAIKRATLYATCLGIYEAHLNGKKIGNDYFAPGWTNYNKRVYYQTYDVTKQVKQGENTLGFVLAGGWYSGYVGYALLVKHPKAFAFYGEAPTVMAQLEVEYADGTKQTIITDADWSVNANGPYKEADLLMGEVYDARDELSGWDTPGYDATAWPACRRMVGAMGLIQPSPAEPVQVVEQIKPISMAEPKPGIYVFNMGTNFAGNIELKVKGQAGTRLTLRYGEMAYPNGNVMTENLRKARATDVYILKGDPNGETWTPRFTYHGFQYVEITGLTQKPDLSMVTGLVLSSQTPKVGSFETGNTLVNQLYRNIVRTQTANYMDIPTDCPQRDERMGWTGDAQIYIRSATFNSDIAAFHTKWLTDLNDDQLGVGAYPNFAPIPYNRLNTIYSPAWMDAGIICPYTIFKVYNDKEIITRHYANMQKFMTFYQRKSTNNLLPEDSFSEVSPEGGFGDWLNQGKIQTSNHFIANAYWLYDLGLMAEMASAIGKTDDAIAYQQLYDQVQQAFMTKYLDSNGFMLEKTQTACVMAIDMNLVPETSKKALVSQLRELIAVNKGYLESGFLGVKHLLPALSNYGYPAEATDMFLNEGFPSWLFEVVNGATSIWERWDSYTKKKGFGGKQNASMNSFSHYSFGSVAEWMFRNLAGIDMLENGYQKIRIRPECNSRIGFANVSYHCPQGEIKSHWEIKGKDVLLNVTIPANTTAEVYIPANSDKQVSENGLPLSKVAGVLAAVPGIPYSENTVKMTLGSGTYSFVSMNGASALAK